MNKLLFHLTHVWKNDIEINKKILNFSKLYNKRLSKIYLADDLVEMINNKLKNKYLL